MTDTPDVRKITDVRGIAAKAMYMLGDPTGEGFTWEETDAETRRVYLRRTDAVLSAVEPVIRRQVAEEIAEAIELRFDHLHPEWHSDMLGVADWCEGEARRHAQETCICGTPGTGNFEGPLRDCPVHGEPAAQHTEENP